MAQLDIRALLAFLNPFGVWLKEGKHFLGGRNLLPVEQTPLDQIQMLVEHPLKIFQPFPMGGLYRLIAQAEQAVLDFSGKLVSDAHIVPHCGLDAFDLVCESCQLLAASLN